MKLSCFTSSRYSIYYLPNNQVTIVLKYLLFVSEGFYADPEAPLLQLNIGKRTNVGSVVLSVFLLFPACMWPVTVSLN